MIDVITALVAGTFDKFQERLLSFLPNLLLAAVALSAGIGLSLLVRYAVQKLLVAIGLDRHAEKSGIRDILYKSGMKGGFSRLVADIVFWILVTMFAIISLNSLNLPQVDKLLSEFFLYLPNIFVAIAVSFIGYIISNFLAKVILVGGVNAGIKKPGILSRSVKIIVIFLAVTIAMEQLGIGQGTMLVFFTISFGGLVLALAIAFGLGAKDLARNFLEKQMNEEPPEEKDKISHI